MARYLRFAVAGFFAMVTLAMIGLWIRSYWRCDLVAGPIGEHHVGCGTNRGIIMLKHGASVPEAKGWAIRSYAVGGQPPIESWSYETYLGFGIARHVFGDVELFLPHWFLMLTSAWLATVFAFKRTWRFTIRTLLIATTLLAAVLGLGVYLL